MALKGIEVGDTLHFIERGESRTCTVERVGNRYVYVRGGMRLQEKIAGLVYQAYRYTEYWTDAHNCRKTVKDELEANLNYLLERINTIPTPQLEQLNQEIKGTTLKYRPK